MLSASSDQGQSCCHFPSLFVRRGIQRESPSNPTNGQETGKIFQRKIFHVLTVFVRLVLRFLLDPVVSAVGFRPSGFAYRELAKKQSRNHCQKVGLRKPTTSMTGCQGGSFSPKLCRSWHFTVIRDQLQDYGFSSTFVQLHDLPTSFVGLQECGLADIFQQLVERKHRVLTGI